MRLNQKGFSLIELMIVVAIIGILAAIAVPNYMSFQRKARQSEARSTAGAIAQALTIYQQDAGGYTDDIFAAGYIPDGTILYDCGFAGAPTVYGPQDAVILSGAAYPTPYANTGSSGLCGSAQAPNCVPAGGGAAGVAGYDAAILAGTVAPAGGAYTGACAGWIGGQVFDNWTFNNLKLIVNNQSGI